MDVSSPEIQAQPEFKNVERLYGTRAFEIYALSTDPAGIEIVPGDLLPRPNLEKVLLDPKLGQYGKDILAKITADISGREAPGALKEAIKDSMDTKQEQARIQLLKDKVGLTEDQLKKYMEELQAGKLTDSALLSGGDVSRYLREYEHNQKVGMFNVQLSLDGKSLKADFRKVPFVMYKHIRTKKDEDLGLLDLANPTGCAVIIETTEANGENYFGLGRRGERNASYRATTESGGQPGAWAAGIIDLNFSRYTEPGLPENFNNTKVFNRIDKELAEETGMSSATYEGQFVSDVKQFANKKIQTETGTSPSDIENMKITSFGKDLLARHNEIGLVAKTRWGREKLIDIHSKMHRSEKDYDFAEEVFFIPATKEAVAKYLTECRTPMPPTHYMPLMAAMYEKIVTQGKNSFEAKAEADVWMKQVEAGIDRNWEIIDGMVEQFYKDNPEAEKKNKEESKSDTINTQGFEPKVLADKQGLPTHNAELVRLGFTQAA